MSTHLTSDSTGKLGKKHADCMVEVYTSLRQPLLLILSVVLTALAAPIRVEADDWEISTRIRSATAGVYSLEWDRRYGEVDAGISAKMYEAGVTPILAADLLLAFFTQDSLRAEMAAEVDTSNVAGLIRAGRLRYSSALYSALHPASLSVDPNYGTFFHSASNDPDEGYAAGELHFIGRHISLGIYAAMPGYREFSATSNLINHDDTSGAVQDLWANIGDQAAGRGGGASILWKQDENFQLNLQIHAANHDLSDTLSEDDDLNSLWLGGTRMIYAVIIREAYRSRRGGDGLIIDEELAIGGGLAGIMPQRYEEVGYRGATAPDFWSRLLWRGRLSLPERRASISWQGSAFIPLSMVSLFYTASGDASSAALPNLGISELLLPAPGSQAPTVTGTEAVAAFNASAVLGENLGLRWRYRVSYDMEASEADEQLYIGGNASGEIWQASLALERSGETEVVAGWSLKLPLRWEAAEVRHSVGSGTPDDAGVEPNAGTPDDAGAEPTSGTPDDAGAEPTAGTPNSAGGRADSGTPNSAGGRTRSGGFLAGIGWLGIDELRIGSQVGILVLGTSAVFSQGSAKFSVGGWYAACSWSRSDDPVQQFERSGRVSGYVLPALYDVEIKPTAGWQVVLRSGSVSSVRGVLSGEIAFPDGLSLGNLMYARGAARVPVMEDARLTIKFAMSPGIRGKR